MRLAVTVLFLFLAEKLSNELCKYYFFFGTLVKEVMQPALTVRATAVLKRIQKEMALLKNL